jgi:hypothetical protein
MQLRGKYTMDEYKFVGKQIVDTSMVLMGQSGSGKTVIIHNVLKALHGISEQIVVFSPTADSNKAYEGFVPRPLIHTDLSTKRVKGKGNTGLLQILDDVVQRQKAFTDVYRTVNKLENLQALYQKYTDKACGRVIKQLSICRSRTRQSIESTYADNNSKRVKLLKEVDERFNNLLSEVFKKAIKIKGKEIKKDLSKLTDMDRLVFANVDFNPRLVIVFDDCAAELKPHFSHEIFRVLLYQGRHYFVTSIFTCQSDTDMPVNLRQNAFITILTSPVSAYGYFRKDTNKMASKSDRQDTKIPILDCIDEIFRISYRKLVYVRDDSIRNCSGFFFLQCDIVEPFMFTSDSITEICRRAEGDASEWNSDNPFYNKFRNQMKK